MIFPCRVLGIISLFLTSSALAAQSKPLSIHLENVDVASTLRAIQITPPVAVSGKLSVDVEVDDVSALFQDWRAARFQAGGTLSGLRLGSVLFEEIHMEISNVPGRLRYRLNAPWLGGELRLDGLLTDGEPSHRVIVHVEEVRLSRLARMLHIDRRLPDLDGLVTARMEFDLDQEKLTGSGLIRVERLRWQGRAINGRGEAELRLDDRVLRFERIEARFYDGVVTGNGRLDLENFDRSRASLRVRRLPLGRLFVPIPGLDSFFELPVDARLETTLGREIRGHGVISMASGQIAGLSIGDLRVPLRWTVIPDQERGEVRADDIQLRLGRGRLSGHFAYAWFASSGARVEGDLRFSNVETNPLLNLFSSAAAKTGGYATGRLTLNSANMLSLKDLNARLTVRFSQLQAFQVPVLDDLVRFVSPINSAAFTAPQAALRASLQRGVIRIEEFSQVSPALQVFIYGNVTLEGRLDLQVIVNTGRLAFSPTWLRLVGITIPVTVGPIPVGLLLEISDFVSRRTIQLSVTGTTRNPVIRIDPIRLLSQEAARFFLNRASIPIP